MNVKILIRKSILWLLLIFLSFSTVSQAQDTDPKNDIMFQGFWWDSYQDPNVSAEGGLYNYLKARAPQLQAAGFDVVWTPPPSQGDGMGYFPKQLFSYGNAHGSQAQLTSMLADFNSRGIHGMADIIANHRSGTTGWADFTNPTWDCTALVTNDEVNGVAGQIQPCSGQNDEGEGFPGCRDLNHKSPQVQQGFRDYLNNLKALGFDSWRYDFTKGFPAHYVGEYNGSSNPYFSVGEYWDANIGLLTSWVNNSGNTFTGTTKRSSTFDFSLYYILARAINNGNWYELNNGGKMPGLAGTYGYADYAVTFVENHDTHEITGTTNILKANAYILTHPGIPMVFSKHWLDNKQKINELMAVRKQNNITAWSSTNVVESTGFYAAYIDNKVAVKIGPGMWSPTGTGWILNTSGTDYAVWSKINITTPSVTPEAFLNISLIGTAVGGWGTDVPMETTDGITYKLYSQTIAAGKAKFRANQSWSANWGAATFPTGTGVSYGAEIPTVAGSYNVTFNRQTGAYSFSAPTAPPANNYTLLTVVGPAVGGWGTDVVFPTNDGITYTLTDYTFLAGALKIRQDYAWTKNWGSASFPSGTGIQAGVDIPVPAGVYTLTFNILTGAYTFYGTDTKVGIIGTAVGGWATDIDMTSKDNGVNYTLDYTFTTGEVKFRKDDAWTVNWGAATFPTGTGVLAGPNIPVTAGTYKVSFNATTGAYNFQQVSSSISQFTPTTGATGTSVTISGSNFTGATAVKFGGVAATSFTVVNPSTITAVVGAGSTGVVTVETPLGTAASAVNFVYAMPGASISSFNPTSASTGATVTISGSNFTGATAVKFGGTNATSFTVVDANTITAVVGAGASGQISVTTLLGTVNSATSFSLIPLTTINSSYCNNTLSALNTGIVCNSISGSQMYRFKVISDGIERTFETATNSFRLTDLVGSANYGKVYSVNVSVKFNDVWGGYGATCIVNTPTTPPLTKIKSTQCGVTISSLGTTLYADVVNVVEGYKFKVTAGGVTREYNTSNSYFKLTQLTGGAQYVTSYSIQVSVKYNGVYGAFGNVCIVTTPSPVTTINSSYCNNTLSALNTGIVCNSISGSQMYRFKVISDGIERTFETATNSFRLTDLVGSANYGKVYSVNVSVKFNDVWGGYGATCIVNTPTTPPLTKIKSTQCGVTISSLGTTLYANVVNVVEGYKFKVTAGGVTREYNTTNSYFKLTQLTGGAQYGTSYSIQVSLKYNGVYGEFGDVCIVTTPAAKSSIKTEESVETTLYPNPYNESFKIAFSSDDEAKVQIMIYDASGRLVSQKETTATGLESDTFGEGLSAGVYTVLVQQGERVETLRAVKQ